MSYFNRKLRPPAFSPETIIGLSVLPIFIVIMLTFGHSTAFGFIAVVEFIAAFMVLLQFMQTKNFALFYTFIFLLVVGIFMALISHFGLESKPKIMKVFSFWLLTGIVVLLILFIQRKLKWKTREILELAAMPIEDAKNGFTERPFSAGKIDCTNQSLLSFSEFLERNLIAISIRESDKYIFSLDNSYLTKIGLKKDYKNDTYVSFDLTGNVMVNFSQKDYMKYNDSFTFDQLCNSLGHLFIEFFEMHRKGKGQLVIDRINSLRLNIITE